ncbi:MAG: hypothetical protein ABFD83_08450 [Armatimonadota bacterium]
MSITGVSSNSESVYDLYQLYATQSVSGTSSDDSDTSIAGVSSTGASVDSADFSKAGELFSKLQQLQETDPDKFKEICANIAEQLSEAAENEDGSSDGMLTDLASKFKDASETGDMSSLQPPPPPPASGCSGSMQDVSELYSQNESTGQSGQKNTIDSIIAGVLSQAGISVSS